MKQFFSRIGSLLKKPFVWIAGLPTAVVVVLLLAVGATGVAAYNYHDSPEFCGTCHIMQSYVDTYVDDEMHYLANKHAAAGVTCMDCHSDYELPDQVDGLITYIEGDYRDPLRRRKFDNEMCFGCHNHDSYEEIAARTATIWELAANRNPHDSPHYENLECNVCHRSHRESEIYCSECHQMPYLGEGWVEPPILDNPVP